MDRDPHLSEVRTPSIRMSLASLVIGCVLPVVLVSAFLIFNFYEHEQIQLTNNAISRARAMISNVDRGFASTQAALQALGTSHRLTSGDLRGFHARATEELRNLHAENIIVIDPSGQLLLSTWVPFGTPLPKLAKPSLRKRILETGEPIVSNLFLGPVTHHPIFAIEVPVKREGALIYTLAATIAPAQLSSVLTEQKLPNSWRAAIVDHSGSLVARTHGIDKLLGKKASSDLLQRMSLSGEAGFKSKTLEGIPVLSVYSKSPVTGWAVVIGMPLGELTAGLRQTLTWLILATISALTIGLALAWYLSGRITRSITALTQSAVALGFGERPTIPPLHFREANQLRQALLDAATTLHQAKYDAQHDALTGLANRALFHIVITQQLALCQRNSAELAILYIDLDGFKTVNDTHGHALGDQLLRDVSVRLKRAIRKSDIAARLGGDEFVIALIHSSLENANAFAGKLIEIISEPYRLGVIEAHISASIGIAGYPRSATDVDILLKNADHAMYMAKSLGKGRVSTSLR